MKSADDYYRSNYENVTNSGLIGFVSRLVHLSMELKPYSNFKSDTIKEILELGAGQGQHSKFVKNSFITYLQTDFRPELLPQNTSQHLVGGKIITEKKQ